MSLNLIKTFLILNAKKGWSDVARKKAAMTRKSKRSLKSQDNYSPELKSRLKLMEKDKDPRAKKLKKLMQSGKPLSSRKVDEMTAGYYE